MADDDKESEASETSPLLDSNTLKKTSTITESISKTVSWKEDIEESSASRAEVRLNKFSILFI